MPPAFSSPCGTRAWSSSTLACAKAGRHNPERTVAVQRAVHPRGIPAAPKPRPAPHDAGPEGSAKASRTTKSPLQNFVLPSGPPPLPQDTLPRPPRLVHGRRTRGTRGEDARCWIDTTRSSVGANTSVGRDAGLPGGRRRGVAGRRTDVLETDLATEPATELQETGLPEAAPLRHRGQKGRRPHNGGECVAPLSRCG